MIPNSLPEAPEEENSNLSELSPSILSMMLTSVDEKTQKLFVDKEQQKKIMHILTLMQAGHLMDIFKIMEQTTEFCRRGFQLLYDPELISGELGENPRELQKRLDSATQFMQKYMNYAQKFTIGNQEILSGSGLSETETAVVQFLSKLSEDQLEDLVKYLGGLVSAN